MSDDSRKLQPFRSEPPGPSDELAFHQFLDYRVEEVREGYARITMPCGPNVNGGIGGSVHGGILASLVDIATIEAVFPVISEAEVPGGTIDLSITYLRPTMGSRVVASATIIRRGRRIIVTEVDIKDDRDRLCARGRVLYAVRSAS